METEHFENKLLQMKKPEVTHLEHEQILAEAIINAKDKFVLSLWWLSIPLYVIGAFIMKSLYMPQATLFTSIHEFATRQRLLSILLFIVAPIVFIVLNFVSIRNTNKISGSLKYTWLNFLVIICSILLLLIYIL